MSNEHLSEKLQGLKSATAASTALLKQLFSPVSYKKGTLLNGSEHFLAKLCFIENGMARGYFFHEGEEHTLWIVENGFFLRGSMFIKQSIFAEQVQFMQNTSGWVLNLRKAEALAQQDVVVGLMLIEIYEELTSWSRNREMMLRIKKAEDRFDFMQALNFDLHYRITNDICASFLNIAGKYLFAIKKNKLKK